MKYFFSLLIISTTFFSFTQDSLKSFKYEPGIELDYNVPSGGTYLNSWPNFTTKNSIRENGSSRVSLSLISSHTLLINNGIIEGNIGLTYTNFLMNYSSRIQTNYEFRINIQSHQLTVMGQLLGGYQFNLKGKQALRLVGGFFIGHNFDQNDLEGSRFEDVSSENLSYNAFYKPNSERLGMMMKFSYVIPTKNLKNSFEVNIKYYLGDFVSSRYDIELLEGENIIYQANASATFRNALSVGASFNFR